MHATGTVSYRTHAAMSSRSFSRAPRRSLLTWKRAGRSSDSVDDSSKLLEDEGRASIREDLRQPVPRNPHGGQTTPCGGCGRLARHGRHSERRSTATRSRNLSPVQCPVCAILGWSLIYFVNSFGGSLPWGGETVRFRRRRNHMRSEERVHLDSGRRDLHGGGAEESDIVLRGVDQSGVRSEGVP
eukprot:Polyplicarium_translucidae@DN3385_c1_g1_i18.p1